MGDAGQMGLRPLDLRDVTVGPGFLGRRVRVNRRQTIPAVHRQLVETGRLDTLKMDWKPGRTPRPHQFYDSDIAKWIEAASYSLATRPDAGLERQVDRIIRLFAGVQRADGYLNSYFCQVAPRQRWTNLRDMHELYCAGHLIEAAVAHFQATGKRTLLDPLCRYADHIDSVFGRGHGKKRGYPGHEEIELALVKLYRATGERRYLRLSEYFVNQRGARPHYFDAEAKARGEPPRRDPAAYDSCQAHLPVRLQAEATGHAVRAMYLYSAMADLAAETGDASLRAACERLWDSTTLRRMYVTGGVGSAAAGERFTEDFDLPNGTAYAETCAAIGLVFFARRMANLTADGRYADVMERALYNGVLSGVSLDGKRFLYANPLAHYGDRHAGVRHMDDGYRRSFYGCACCPPNIARLLASIGAYIYSAAPDALYVHLYSAGSATAALGGARVRIAQQTDYPWDGRVRLAIRSAAPARWALMLRIPGWCERHAIRVNGRPFAARVVRGYARLVRQWRRGDVVELSMDVPVRRVEAHPLVAQDVGRVALQRGPIVYCLEQVDHAADVHTIVLPDRAGLAAVFEPKLLGGVTVLRGRGLAVPTAGWAGRLYRPVVRRAGRPVKLTAVPYCLWNNRGNGAMAVWLPHFAMQTT